jgi:hypothetical protein
VVRGLVAPLTAIDTPRRAIISGIREVTDLLDSDPETKASFGDFVEQTKDPTYGVGSAFPDPTGNKWVDRLIGFAGDVALDPITYATLGYGKVATLGARAAYAGDLLRAGRALGRVDEVAPIAQKLTQRGVGGLNSAERQLYDEVIRAGRIGTGGAGSEVGQAGIRFRVPFTGRQTGVIPGTQRIAEGLGGALSSARLRAGQSAAGQRVRRAVVPRERVDLYEQMVMGGDPNTLTQRLFNIAAGDAGTAARNIAGRRLGATVDDIAASGRNEGLSGEELTRQLSSGSVAAADDTVAGRARGFLDDGRQELSDAGSTIQYRENYVPRVYTDEYDEVVRGALGDEVRQTIGVVDDLSQEGITQTRQINAGDTLSRGTQKVVLEGDDPFSFNKAMNELYPELGESFKFVETDGYKLLERWARSASAELGRLRYADEIVRSGLGAARSQVTRAPGITGRIAEETAETVPGRVDDIRAGRQAAAQEAAEATESARQTLAGRVERFAGADEARAARAGARADRTVNQILQRMDTQIREIDDQIAGLDARAASISADTATPQEVSFLQDSLQRSRQALEDARAGVGDPATDDVVEGLLSESQRLTSQAEEFARSARALRSGAADPRVAASQRRVAAATERQSEAERLVRQAADGGFAPSLDGENAAASITANLERIPEEGNKRLRREARALVEDVPEGELLTRDQRYLAGLRQAAKDPNDVSAQVAYAIETKIAAEGGKGRTFNNFFEVLYGKSKNSADFRENILDELEDGWRMIEGTGVAVPEEIYRMRQRLVELREPEAFTGFLKAWETYTKLFKAYVTATPRFHIRNGMSASFMNWSEGVSSLQMIEGVRIWKKYSKGGMKALDGRERTIIESVLGSGSGQYDMIEVGLRAPLGTRTSRKVGTNVESGVRAGLAVKVIDEGGSFEEALASITRVHFNYSQYSNVDRIARQVFPFWTFMSRNLPLQVTQMWSKPRAYARFNTLVRNIRTDDEETGLVPDYFLEGGGFRLPFRIPGVGQYARPDLGFSRVDEDVDRMSDPIRFLADANPLIKAAVENFAGKQLYKDIPLDDESYVPLEGWQQLLAPLLSASGKLEQGRDGPLITPKTEYLLDQINPFGGLFNRYSGEGSRNEDKAIKNLLGASGLPSIVSLGGYVRDLTPEVQQSAARRQQYEQREALRKLQEIARAS